MTAKNKTELIQDLKRIIEKKEYYVNHIRKTLEEEEYELKLLLQERERLLNTLEF